MAGGRLYCKTPSCFTIPKAYGEVLVLRSQSMAQCSQSSSSSFIRDHQESLSEKRQVASSLVQLARLAPDSVTAGLSAFLQTLLNQVELYGVFQLI
jgi:hypothetical protein